MYTPPAIYKLQKKKKKNAVVDRTCYIRMSRRRQNKGPNGVLGKAT
jgi:hypothetical protein